MVTCSASSVPELKLVARQLMRAHAGLGEGRLDRCWEESRLRAPDRAGQDLWGREVVRPTLHEPSTPGQSLRGSATTSLQPPLQVQGPRGSHRCQGHELHPANIPLKLSHKNIGGGDPPLCPS